MSLFPSGPALIGGAGVFFDISSFVGVVVNPEWVYHVGGWFMFRCAFLLSNVTLDPLLVPPRLRRLYLADALTVGGFLLGHAGWF